ncbi:autophagy-related protein 13-domain-containing protein [Lentinula raphanica]|nr:autophagy-related protein 13-domain-containing protein [Lentinula raphanica]
MSHDAQKADQITFRFHTKLFSLLNDARATASAETNTNKTEKWFNIETPDPDLWTKEGRELYKTISALRTLPPLEIQVLLTVPDTLTNNQVLVYISPDSSRVPIQTVYKYILLERWTLELNFQDIYPSSSDSSVSSTSTGSSGGSGSVSLATLYKHGISLFRSLYSLLRVLPAWKLSKRLRTRRPNAGGLGVQVRVKGDPGSGLDESLVMRFDSPSALPTTSDAFRPIQHPKGTLNLSATYLTSPNFRIDEKESLLSSRFMSMDMGGGGTKGTTDFVPTLVKNQQRDSLLSSAGGSLSTRSRLSSLPRSPPRDILRRPLDPPYPYPYPHSRTLSDADSIAERFIIPSRTASNPTDLSSVSDNPPPISTHNVILPITRATTTTSTSTQPLSDLASRIRRESLGYRNTASDTHLPLTTTAGTSTQPFPSSSTSSTSTSGFAGATGISAPSTSLSSSPMHMRRPGLNTVHPFKSNTLAGAGNVASSSSSPRVTSGLSGVAGSALGSGAVSSSPHGAGAGTGLASLSSLSNLSNLPRRPSSPSSLNRPSPPSHTSYTPSSVGAVSTSGVPPATAPSATGTEEIAVPPRKRYSSSFGHRYSSSPARGGAAMSIGSQGSQGGSGIVEGAGAGMGGMGGVIGSLGQASVRSGMSGMSGMSMRSRRSVGSGSAGGGGSGSASGMQDPAPASTYPDFPVERERQGLTHDDHEDISTFMQDIDTRKPLIGRSRIYANANAQLSQPSGSSGDATQVPASDEAESDDDRQRTIRAWPLPRSDSKESLERHAVGQTSPLFQGVEPPRVVPSSHRGSRSPSASPVTPPSSRRASYTGLSPPSSPLRNVIPLVEEDDDEQGRSFGAPTQPRPVTPASGRNTLGLGLHSPSGAGGTPSSPPSHSSPMLTTAPDVEARLKKMNETFLASLEGLGGKSTKDRKGKGKEREGS